MAEEWIDAQPVSVVPDAIDIKLFGRWSTSDVQVSDISLTVSSIVFLTYLTSLEL